MPDILFLAHRIPWPPNRGDKIRAFHIVEHLSRLARVHVVAFVDDPRDLDAQDGLAPYAASRTILWRGKPQWRAAIEALASGRPVSVAAFADAAMRRAVADVLARENIDAIYVFSGQMAQYLPADAATRTVMDFVDMDSAKFAGYAAEGQGPRAWMMAREARLLERFERDIAARCDASLFVSEAEAALFRARTGAKRVHAVENGIDTEQFDPAAGFAPVALAPDTIVFTGQMDYPPNIAAVRWFADDILPIVRATHPDARFAIVGRAPTDAVRALGDRPGVTVTGEVDDVRGWLAAAAAVVAPLKLARGIQNKVLEAMAMARPVVASAAAAEGIDHAGTIRVGSDAAAIARELGALLADRQTAAALGQLARTRVIARYGWDARLAPLAGLLGIAPVSHRSAA